MTRTVLVAAIVLIGTGVSDVQSIEVDRIGRVPVYFEGRVMPIESTARIVVYRFSGRRRTNRFAATEWFVRTLTDPFTMVDEPLFLVDDPAVLDAVGFPNPKRGRYAYREIHSYIDSLHMLTVSLAAVSRPLDATEQGILALTNNVRLFEGIASTFDILRADPDVHQLGASALPIEPDALAELPGMMRLIPIDGPQGTEWLTPAASVRELLERGGSAAEQIRNTLGAWAALHNALSAPTGREDQAVARAVSVLAESAPTSGVFGVRAFAVGVELLHNRIDPGRLAGWIALAGLVVVPFLRRSHRLEPVAPAVIGTAAALLTGDVVARIVITGRPPVTDLPSSFVFVAWLIALTGTALAMARRTRIAGVILGATTTVILIYLSRLFRSGEDPFAAVQAVLDTNLWLGTHVLVITAGYAAVIAAGIIAHFYLVQRIYQPYRRERHQATYRMVVTASLIGLALTFIGTMLGGVWADQAWGRFWGWDPKENGALLIIVWVSIGLHGRITRWLDQAGFAAMSAFGVAVVFFSWLGVNLMGVGLHSYGFSDASFLALFVVIGFEALFAVAGWMAARRSGVQRSFAPMRVVALHADGDSRVITLDARKRPSGTRTPAGAYVGVRPDGFVDPKPFSIVDDEDGRWRLLVKRSGPVSSYLIDRLRIGETLSVSEPSGSFRFDSAAGVPVVVAAGGVGIASVLRIVRASLQDVHPTVLIRACRDYFYLDEDADALRELFPGLRVIDVLSRPGTETTALVGRISSGLLASDGAGRQVPHNADWYVCGSPGFCDAAREVAVTCAARRVREEPYLEIVARPHPPAVRSHVVVSARRIPVAAGQTILEALLDSGVDIRHSCMTGTCGECACVVSAGAAVQPVPPYQATAGDTVRTCVAYPQSEDPPTISVGDLPQTETRRYAPRNNNGGNDER